MSRMSFRHWFALAATAAALAVTMAPKQSWADAPNAQLREVGQSGGVVRLLLTASGLPAGSGLDPGSVVATLNGSVATVAATRVSATTTRVPPRVMLVLDTSGSMSGAGLAGARAAAAAFLRRVPGNVQVGLVTFSSRPELRVPPTTARAGLRAALLRIRAAGETSLYDGIDLALRELGDTRDAAIVVLSDGADTRSVHTQSRVAAELRRSGVRMDAVALHTGDSTLRVLTALATATRGDVFPAGNGAELARAFSSAAEIFATQLLVDVTIPASQLGRDVTVTITAGGSVLVKATTLLHTLAVASTPRAVTSRQAPAATAHSSTSVVVPLALLFGGLVLMLYAALSALGRRTSSAARATRLLDRFTLKSAVVRRDPDTSPVGSGAVARQALGVAERFAARGNRRERITVGLARADVDLKPNEWVVIRFGAGFLGLVLGLVLFRVFVVALIIAALGYLGTGLWLSFKARRRLRAFEEHLPAALQLVASSVRAGFSFAQSLDGLVREGMEPIASEVNRALGESRLGIPIEDALDNLAHRMDSEDFRWVAMAIRIQREVGGNLAEVLLNTAMMMRERAKLRRQVKALSAEGRLSAYVLIALPILMSLYMFALRRSYLRPLYTEKIGVAMLIFAVVLLVVGAVWMRKTVEVDV